MKKFKKIVSLLLALVMVCAMGVTALAADTYTISLDTDTTGYAYNVYQIFTGDYDEGSGILSNIEFGTALSATDQATVLAYYEVSSAAELAELLNDDNAAAFAKYIASFSLTLYGTLNDTTTSISADPGYYLIVNTTIPTDGTVGYSDYILEVVDDLTISPKDNSVPTFDKAVGDENTNNDEATEDYAVGDDVDFTLTATLPSSYSSYTTYALTFHDTLSDGLSFNNDVVVKVGNTVVASSCYTVVTEDLTDGCSFEVVITDTNSLVDEDGSAITVATGSVITVEYTAELLSTAASIETNAASLEYSNDPNSSSTGKTETDTTYVVTFDVTVNKVNEDSNPLTGAAFALYTTDESSAYTVLVKEFTVDETTTSFSFDGLAIGDYMLVETTTPAGYNTIDPIYFTISATAVEDATEEDGVAVTTTSITNFTIDADGTGLSTTVVNEKGSNLPSTGGIGTTIFYVVGTIMVLGAVVVLITRKRMSAE